MGYLLIWLGMLGIAYRSVWFARESARRCDAAAMEAPSRDGFVLHLLGWGFAGAFALATIVWLAAGNANADVIVIRGDKGVLLHLALLSGYTCIAWICAFLAIGTALGPSRQSYFDWGMVPVFALLVSALTPGEQATVTYAHALCLAGTAIVTWAIKTKPLTESKAGSHFPSSWSARHSLWLGVILSLASSASFVFVLEMVDALKGHVSREAQTAARFAPLGPVCLIAAWMYGLRRGLPHYGDLRFVLGLAILSLTPIYFLFAGIGISDESAAIADAKRHRAIVLSTVPVFVLLFSLSMRLRTPREIPFAEWLGFALISTGLLVSELA